MFELAVVTALTKLGGVVVGAALLAAFLVLGAAGLLLIYACVVAGA